MERPRTRSELVDATGWTLSGLSKALGRLQNTGDILFDGTWYRVKEVPRENVARRGSVQWPPAPAKPDQPPAWFKNPPQPDCRSKTRKRDRE